MDRFRFQLLSAFALLLLPTTLLAANHLILIDELFSSADGAVQFLELRAEADFQTQLISTHIVATNHDGTEQVIIYDFVEVFPELDEGETILLATAGFEALFGFAPDFIIPDGSLFAADGRIAFVHESPCPGEIINCEIDAVAYGNYISDNGAYGIPAPVLPGDGALSLVRIGETGNNAADFAPGEPTPTRNDGVGGSLPGDFWFIRGDVDGSGTPELDDAIDLLNYLFASGALPCLNAGDFDGDGALDLADSLGLLSYLFLGGATPPPPFPGCGPNFGGTGLGCSVELDACPDP